MWKDIKTKKNREKYERKLNLYSRSKRCTEQYYVNENVKNKANWPQILKNRKPRVLELARMDEKWIWHVGKAFYTL